MRNKSSHVCRGVPGELTTPHSFSEWLREQDENGKRGPFCCTWKPGLGPGIKMELPLLSPEVNQPPPTLPSQQLGATGLPSHGPPGELPAGNRRKQRGSAQPRLARPRAPAGSEAESLAEPSPHARPRASASRACGDTGHAGQGLPAGPLVILRMRFKKPRLTTTTHPQLLFPPLLPRD